MNSLLNNEYLRNDTRYRQSGSGAGNYKGLRTSSQICMNFGSQTAKIGPEVNFDDTTLRFTIGLHVLPILCCLSAQLTISNSCISEASTRTCHECN